MIKFLFLLLCASFLFVTSPAQAHLPGQPPFFKINGTYSDFYPVLSNLPLSEYPLPQDMPPENYLINEAIELEIDTDELQKFVPKDVVEKTKFIWDFGDGQIGKEKTMSHMYEDPPEYIFSALRIIDENGFIADASIGMKHNSSTTNGVPKSNSTMLLAFLIPAFLVVLILAVLFVLKGKGGK